MRNLQKGNEEATVVLANLIPRVTYKPGWSFELAEISRGQGCEGLTLLIGAPVEDSFGHGPTNVLHLMPVLPANYDEESWMDWVLEQIMMVEKHETLEFFRVDGDQPFFPGHKAGVNPYSIRRTRPRDVAHGDATPWTGGSPQDEHFD